MSKNNKLSGFAAIERAIENNEPVCNAAELKKDEIKQGLSFDEFYDIKLVRKLPAGIFIASVVKVDVSNRGRVDIELNKLISFDAPDATPTEDVYKHSIYYPSADKPNAVFMVREVILPGLYSAMGVKNPNEKPSQVELDSLIGTQIYVAADTNVDVKGNTHVNPQFTKEAAVLLAAKLKEAQNK